MNRPSDFNVANSKLLDRVMPLPVLICWGVAAASAARPLPVVLLGLSFVGGNVLLNALVSRRIAAGVTDLRPQGWMRVGLMVVMMSAMAAAVGPDGAWWLPPLPGLMAIPLLLPTRSALAGGLGVLAAVGAVRGVAFGAEGMLVPMVIDLVALSFMLPVTTTLRERERQLVAMASALAEEAERANAASRAKSGFLARMSHEIRTPLSGITSALELVGLESDPDAHKPLLAAAAQSAGGLRELLDGVLDLSKIEAGEMTVEHVPTSLVALKQQIDAAFQPLATEKGVSLEVLVRDADTPWGLSDPVRLRQIVLNLVSNALKFTASGSVQVEMMHGEGRLVVSVADTGEGIAPERLEQIFSAFQQADETTTRRHGGTGLGLALVRELSALLGGIVRAESTPGEGATFVVSLPWASCAAPAQAAEGTLPQLGLRILVAEDNAVNQLVLRRQLALLGCTAVIAGDGEAALAALRDEPFDAVLLDCHMPIRDGFWVASEARAAGLAVPIIALTASALRSVQERCEAAGMDDFLTKPVRLHTLAARLRAAQAAAA